MSDKITSLLSCGNIIPQLQFTWLDTIKAKHESEIIPCLHEICEHFISRKNYLSCLDTANAIHEKYDQLNEKALSFKFLALNKMRAHSKLQNEFSLFKKRYLATYQEAYSGTIDEINKLR